MNLIETLYKIHAIKFGRFVLKSGASSTIYLDLRQIISYPDILRKVSSMIWQTVQSCEFDLLCGVPYTALPIATCISLDQKIPMVMRRKEKKPYGTQQQIEGFFQHHQRCMMIEDVITSGASILETASDLLAAGLIVTDAVVLIDREQNGKNALQECNIRLHRVFTLSEILKTLFDSDLITQDERTFIREFN